MKCTGLKTVSYPDTRHLIKGSTVKFGTNTRIFYIVCYGLYLLNYARDNKKIKDKWTLRYFNEKFII